MPSSIEIFLQKIALSFKQKEFIKMTLGNKKNVTATLKNVLIKPVLIKNTEKLLFTYRHNTQDIFKNYSAAEALPILEQLLQQDFYNADAFTLTGDFQFSINTKGIAKMVTRPASLSEKENTLTHNRQKKRMVGTSALYLHPLGITTEEGVIKKDMQDKFKQINHYLEIIDGIIKGIDFGKSLNVADMGSGKGYLTFALYDYITNVKQINASIWGIEMREDLVSLCNKIAVESNFKKLHFIKGSIQDAIVPSIDMLIALHACDTATDDAIKRGIASQAKVIVCAPCCHKQIRKQMAPDNALKNITKHGILLERQAEMVTDAIRALLLEAHGYKTKVFDFISTEHTPKNVMIAAVKTTDAAINRQESLVKVEELKKLFNIKTHYLETLL
jgi:SAM-dependent methyltransferase